MSKEFEEWARMEGLPLEWLPNFGFYEATRTEQAWRSWQASRQTLVVELPRVTGDAVYDAQEVHDALDKAGVSYK